MYYKTFKVREDLKTLELVKYLGKTMAVIPKWIRANWHIALADAYEHVGWYDKVLPHYIISIGLSAESLGKLCVIYREIGDFNTPSTIYCYERINEAFLEACESFREFVMALNA